MTKFLRLFTITALLTLVASSYGCKKKDPSILKVFVRSNSNELISEAQVIIIGDIHSDPATAYYTDTLQTNSSGFAQFDMSTFFDAQDKNTTTGYFNILVKKNPAQATGYIKCRAHITAVQTVVIDL